MITLTDIDTGNTIILPNNSVQEAFNGDDFCRVITINGVEYNVAGSWADVLQAIGGGGGGTTL